MARRAQTANSPDDKAPTSSKGPSLTQGDAAHPQARRHLAMDLDVHHFQPADAAPLQEFGQAGQQGRAVGAMAGHEHQGIGRSGYLHSLAGGWEQR